MVFDRFEDDDLSQYSYAVGCARTREVAIVDPRRDVDVYQDYATGRDLRITHVLETHIHADFASGARELAEVTGARLALSAYDHDEMFEVGFEHDELSHGDRIQLGGIGIEAVHTPGHTPEHMAYLVYDTGRSEEVPELFLSGDFLFVGSVGRPDLLGEDAKVQLANRLYESLTEVLPSLPDGVEVHPGHGSGSMCGAGMSGRPMSTLGYERVANPYLQPMQRQDFVDKVLAEVPPFPEYYKRMKRLNSEGAASLSRTAPPQPLGALRVRELLDAGHVVVDLRDKEAYAGAHIPGSYYVGHRPGMWGSWTVPYDRPIVLLAGDDEHAYAAWYRGLARVGLDDVRGYLRGGMNAWETHGFDIATTGLITPTELAERLAGATAPVVLDVRGKAAWDSGHIDRAVHMIGGRVETRIEDLPVIAERPLAVICNTGFQSTVVSSVLERHHRTNILNVSGGMAAWREAGLPAEGVA